MMQRACSSSRQAFFQFSIQFHLDFRCICRAYMESRIPYFLGLLMLALVASNAALAPEAYWNSVLPNTPMPKAIKVLLHPDMLEDKGTSVAVGKGAVNVDASPFAHYYPQAASEDEIRDSSNLTIYFLEKDLKPGKSMNTDFSESSNTATFLPRHVADSIPFSSNKLQDAFRELSVNPGSLEAETMENTIKECENPGIEGEEKYCVTSLESMVDFGTSKLGKDIQAISTEVEKQTGRQKYTIAGVKKIAGDKSVVCHKLHYPYAVFYCHSTQSRAYPIQLKGADRSKVKAVATCHTNTSAWNPRHLAFQVLAVKPGTVPVCHFLPQSDVVWAPK